MSKKCSVCGFVGDKKLFIKNYNQCKKCYYKNLKEIKEAFLRDCESRSKKWHEEHDITSEEVRKERLKQYAERRKALGLGHDPINGKFEGSEGHHLHLNGNKNIVVFIPKDLHRSISHNGRTGKGMKEINNAALLWLCTQSIIKPDNTGPSE